MSGEWKVAKIPLGDGEYVYQVYRVRDMTKTDHNGNRDYYGGVMEEKQLADRTAARLNQQEKRRSKK